MLALVLVSTILTPASARWSRFDFDTGNAAAQVVIPKMVPAIRQVSPLSNDASIVLRIVGLVNNAWFDAIAPYHPTAVGIYSRLGRRPASESTTNRNKNIAVLYASYRVLSALLPQNADDWRKMMRSVRLDPDDVSRDTTTPAGIGNVAGWSIIAAREHDGMNQLGDEGGRKYDRQPYRDFTGFAPVNSAYDVVDASKWQPAIFAKNLNQTDSQVETVSPYRIGGTFGVQQFVTPQFATTTPYAIDATAFRAPPPVNSDPYNNLAGYKQQVDEVLAASAGLDDRKKMIAELMDDKLYAFGGPLFYVAKTRGFTMDEFIQMDFLGHIATFDAGIVSWQEKARYNAVRPFTAVHWLYGDEPVTAWGGPGRGTVSDLPGKEWKSYIPVADHPEYPSVTACVCAAYAQSARRYLGSDTLGYGFPAFKGRSRIEPGITPAKTIILGPWETWTDYVNDCAMARFWGGTHFLSALEASKELCPAIGDAAYDFLKKHIDGDVP